MLAPDTIEVVFQSWFKKPGHEALNYSNKSVSRPYFNYYTCSYLNK